MSMPAAERAPIFPIDPESPHEAIHIGADELPFVDLGDGSHIQLLQVDLNQGLWVIRVRFEPGCQIVKHYHSGAVFAVTSRGRWFYKEYPDVVNGPGSYLYEPAGSVHTLTVPTDQVGDTEVWFSVFGANVNLDADGQVINIVDAATILKVYRSLCAKQELEIGKLVVFGE
jgi:quercetin dioxygenase-like cupin family protein